MTISRRDWLAATGLTLASAGSAAPARSHRRIEVPGGLEPWLEVDPAALAHNAATLSRLTGGRSIIAMVKNNAYGLGLETAGPILDRLPAIWGFGVVRPGEAIALKTTGIAKPIVLMGPASDREAEELVGLGVRLTASRLPDGEWLAGLAGRLGRPVPVHLYIDTGMHRMGLPHTRVLEWLDSAPLIRSLHIEGMMTELVEDEEFDREQARRLTALAEALRGRGITPGLLHAASSDAIVKPTPDVFLDLVRPGLALYGGYPTAESMARQELRPAYRLKARIVRLDRLDPGEGVSYHHRFRAERQTWTATLAIGHVDGYPAGAVKGCRVLIGERLYPVVGTVSASHTIVDLGAEPSAAVGEEAVLVGPDRPELHPNVVAVRSGWSEYNMFMHLNPDLARTVRQV
ncbi:MAG TPA: alanine racemase [Gemmatimonadales bacterium]|nr:alanine racemase [Gemmatimonadales bacterium]